MPPKGYKKNPAPETKGAKPIPSPEPPPIVETKSAAQILAENPPSPICQNCPYFVGPNGWGKCKVNPIPADKFASDWCGQHPGRR